MKKYIVIFFFVLLLPLKSYALEKNVKLSNCVDGNSARFIEDKTEIKVKFIGIESAETVISNIAVEDDEREINAEISIDEYVCELLTEAKKITIEVEDNNKEEDKLGRIQVWVKVDDMLLQEHLVSLGYARNAYLYDEYKYKEELLIAENQAKIGKIGVWKEAEIETEDIIVDEVIIEEKEVGFFQKILNFINKIFEGIVKFFDDLIKRWV